MVKSKLEQAQDDCPICQDWNDSLLDAKENESPELDQIKTDRANHRRTHIEVPEVIGPLIEQEQKYWDDKVKVIE